MPRELRKQRTNIQRLNPTAQRVGLGRSNSCKGYSRGIKVRTRKGSTAPQNMQARIPKNENTRGIDRGQGSHQEELHLVRITRERGTCNVGTKNESWIEDLARRSEKLRWSGEDLQKTETKTEGHN